MSLRRLKKEAEDIQKEPNENFSVKFRPEGSDQDHKQLEWFVKLMGPVGTPYEGGVFHLTVKFPQNYPFAEPRIQFSTKIFHPLVRNGVDDGIGIMCEHLMCVLGYPGWSPVVTIKGVLQRLHNEIRDYSEYKEEGHGLNLEAAKLLKENPQEFHKVAKEWTTKYAKI